jgi:Domain of unknown function (DUF4381)
MSAPPLPEIFGNYALGQDFVEVLPPEPVSWLPQTAGWAVLGALLGSYLAWRGALALRRWYRNRYRREACRELLQLGARSDSPELAAALSGLLKRTALAAFPRPRVAGLSGAAWVDFLNSRCADAPFQGSLAAALSRAQYTGSELAPPERQALVRACRGWILHHRGPDDA